MVVSNVHPFLHIHRSNTRFKDEIGTFRGWCGIKIQVSTSGESFDSMIKRVEFCMKRLTSSKF